MSMGRIRGTLGRQHFYRGLSGGQEIMASLLNLGRMDRGLRVVLGIGLAIAGILVSGHPNVGRALGVTGALVILSGGCGT
jgi:GTP1/Obg family GTP-binding protein